MNEGLKMGWESRSLPDLVCQVERRLGESGVLRRAARSALYRRAWGADRERFASASSYQDLRHLPFIDSRDLRDMELETDAAEWPACEHVRLWVSTSGTTGTPKWIPMSDADLATQEETALRAQEVMGVLGPHESTFELHAPAPFYSDLANWMVAAAALRQSLHLERTAVSFTEAAGSMLFAWAKRPRGLVAFPSVAMAMAEALPRQAAAMIRGMLAGPPWLGALAALLVGRVIRPRPRFFFRFRWGVFAGEPVTPYRQAIRAAWGLESYEVYGLSELPVPFSECSAQDGLHLWLDLCLPELIPQRELEREQEDPARRPAALPIWEAEPGMVGELVVTSFGQALPLVRYRTADLVQVVSVGECPCGRHHPRIRVLHRADDLVSLGYIRFPLASVGEQLSGVRQHGRVGEWQLRVTRQGYKPKLIVVVSRPDTGDREAFLAEVRAALDGVPALSYGVQHGILAPPEVRLVDQLSERTGSGKLRRLVYEESAAACPDRPAMV